MAVMMRTMLEVADNSGARKLQMILPLGGSTGLNAGLGDVITAAGKESAPEGQGQKGKVVKAVIVRTRKENRRPRSLRVRTMTAFTTLPFCTWPSGADSLPAAVITSPRPAFNPVEPPSGRIICSFRAPELSATSSIVLIITAISPSPVYSSRLLTGTEVLDRRHFRNQRGLAEDFFQAPPLQLRQRPRLFQANEIAD